MEINQLLQWQADTQAQQQQRQQQLFQQIASHQQQLLQWMAELVPAATLLGPTPRRNEPLIIQGTILTLMLPKITTDDDPESFLVTFERVVRPLNGLQPALLLIGKA